MSAPYVSLADFATTFDEHGGDRPEWAFGGSAVPLLHQTELRIRIEQVLDTVVAVQRASWLQDGVYAGPQAMSSVYGDVLHSARRLRVAVPPAVIAGIGMRTQGVYGTDSRAFLYLSSFFFTESASPEQRRFQTGRLCGHIAARQVTANTIYKIMVDDKGLRSTLKRNLGPTPEVVLAPLGVGVKLALSRWHRAAEITADRAGLLCSGSLEGSSLALLRANLGMNPRIDPEQYMEQLRHARPESDPGKWTELLNDEPFTHKRIRALELFARSQMYARHAGADPDAPDLVDDAELERQTTKLLGVS